MKNYLMVLLFCVLQQSFSQTSQIRSREFNLQNGLAIQGYDPVSYFTDHKAVKGSSGITTTHLGIRYYFSNQQHKQLFVTNPSMYEPQFGGWCAYAMGRGGDKVSIDPETFKIVNGRLYLFYNRLFSNTLKLWNKDEQKLLNEATKNWDKIINE